LHLLVIFRAPSLSLLSQLGVVSGVGVWEGPAKVSFLFQYWRPAQTPLHVGE
jgi:hypothetical protein